MSRKIKPLADDYVTLYESENPQEVYGYSPGICILPSGRLVTTIDIGGPGLVDKDWGPDIKRSKINFNGKVYTSDNQGAKWKHRGDFPFMHARPFASGNSVYILGHDDDLAIMKSDDHGETWSKISYLTKNELWHQAPCNIHYANGCIYLVMERRVTQDIRGWYVGELTPVLMRAKIGGNLLKRESWTFSDELSFRDIIPNTETNPDIDWVGIPFFDSPYPNGSNADGIESRNAAPIGWLESNVIQFVDPEHRWTDPSGKTFHLWARANTGGTGYACIAKVVEQGNEAGTGEMKIMLEKVPSGKTILYTPCPGGQMKFHVLYDEETKLYWLLSTQAIDSMIRVDKMPANRYNLPNNERRRLQLHFSKNMIDWCFAGLVTTGPADHASRNYASMIINGEDLQILSRSGDENSKSAHDGNLVTFHTISNFRELVY
ncbi:MAG: hypothetical protein COA79_24595 [Planctomycetota bacterium]|nr:MAG: hypothetical protein COA79_24595 [Planctomycetota bacterium]